LLDLAYEEYCQRCESGQPVDPEEFCGRFPHFQSSLRRLLGVHHFLEENPELLAGNRQQAWPGAGQEFLGYHLIRELGRGAFARVFLATEPALGQRRVAVKISRFGAAEAKTLGRLNHPNIVPVNTAQVDSKTGFTLICMPYLGSATLCDLLDHVCVASHPPESARVVQETIDAAARADDSCEPHPGVRQLSRGKYVDSVARIGSELAEALALAHSRGICHRDLKPSNVLLAADGRPMLLDFNLASDRQLLDGRLGGTLPYMAPEQLRAMDQATAADAAQIDARSDVYSLGVILYELLAGVHPFAQLPATGSLADARQRLLAAQRRGPRSLTALNPFVDRPLARLVAHCLAFAPAERPQSARELAAKLRASLSRRRRATRWLGRHRGLAILCGLMVTVLLSWAVYAWWTQDPYSVRQQRQGIALYRQGDYREAIEHFTVALTHEPQSPELLFARGRARQQLGDFTMALADYYAASRQGEDARLLACTGYCKWRTGRPQEAVANFKSAIRLGMESAEVYNDLGYCEHRSGNIDGAARALDRAVQLGPHLQAPFHNRALVLLQKSYGDPKVGIGTAVADIRRALENGPPAGDLYRAAASTYAAAGDKEQTLTFLRQAVELGENQFSLKDDALFRAIRSDPRFSQIVNAPRPNISPVKSVRVLDPIKDR
jgi:serine/threonine protein kinase/Flp pilus assembly protein TadD